MVATAGPRAFASPRPSTRRASARDVQQLLVRAEYDLFDKRIAQPASEVKFVAFPAEESWYTSTSGVSLLEAATSATTLAQVARSKSGLRCCS